MVPVLSDDLADGIEAAAVRWGRAWMAGIDGLELADVADHLLVACHPERPELDFQNRVNGLRSADSDAVTGITSFYAERSIRPWFEVVPHDDGAALLDALADIGARPIGYHGVVYGSLTRPPDATAPALPAGVEIHVVDIEDDDEFGRFCATRTGGHELPAEVVAQATADLRGWRTAADATLLLASVDGAPAATAVVTMNTDGVAYLADAATLPAFRGLGLQSALIRRRLDEARQAGCEIACSQATLGSVSHRNLQSQGLVGGFTKTVWRVGGNGPKGDGPKGDRPNGERGH